MEEMELQSFQTRTDFSALHEIINAIRAEIGKVIVGQHGMVDLLITGLLSEGHILIEGVPGVAKTLASKLLAQCVDAQFARIQFTPDLMPADVLGTAVFNPNSREFEYKKGPVFANIVLTDEINRAPAKTQAALFEVMEEQQITNDGITYKLDGPFMVIATQNPIEQEGTYRLPEAQLDRFLFKIIVHYPTAAEEVTMLQLAHQQHRKGGSALSAAKIVSGAQIKAFQEQIRSVVVEDKLLHYISDIIQATRLNASLFMGASPRASLAVMNCAKTVAAMANRDFVTPDDIRYIAPHILRHRIILTPEREMEGISTDEVIQDILKNVEVPR
ncbi:MoxR-like ATPase [Chitinophaga costaii]|uniref:MoxR-like ATPase n=1 Tax=Chitinophaga costaii TaxID=1335309 RepID=A0A1C4G101_9BACT|nr:MoxR family ATPase [Chitinophaga costaii]SCC61860.1 MoxR-like ATPase [Chitinophaga costaii]